MFKIIDTNSETTHALPALKARGLDCVIRYISSSTSLPKVVKPAEARAIANAGLRLALVYETWGGANNFAHNDITAESGRHDGAFARDYAPTVGAPDNTIIWFAIDTDVTASQYENLVKPYLAAVKAALQGKYRIGVYACGFVCDRALQERLVDATWLTQSMGFNGSRDFRNSGRWTLLQGAESTLEGLSIDPNDSNANDFGAFVPFQAAPVTVATGPTAPTTGTDKAQLDLAGIEAEVTRLGQIVAAISQFASTVSTQIPAAAQILSPIDRLLGGTAFVGLKTPIAIFGYAVLWILQSLDAVGTATGPNASTTGSVLTALFSALGAAGVTAKFDRASQAISAILQALQKLTAVAPKADGT